MMARTFPYLLALLFQIGQVRFHDTLGALIYGLVNSTSVHFQDLTGDKQILAVRPLLRAIFQSGAKIYFFRNVDEVHFFYLTR